MRGSSQVVATQKTKCDEWPDAQREHYERLNKAFNFFR
jgi:hypothetical protein